MRNILIVFLILGQTMFAQELYISPLIGIRADVNNSGNPDQTYQYFKTFKPKISFSGLSPLVIGLDIQYKMGKNIFGIGAYYGDQAGSTTGIEFITNSNDPYQYYKRSEKLWQYASWNVFKVPLIYKRELGVWRNNNSKRIVSINLNTGVNLLFLKVKNRPLVINPIGMGTYATSFGDKVTFIGYAGHWRRSFSVSFNLGLDFDFYIKNKRRITLQLYFEQGTRYISNSPIFAYKNGDMSSWWFAVSSASRGSAIHLKLAFPIKIFDFRKLKGMK